MVLVVFKEVMISFGLLWSISGGSPAFARSRHPPSDWPCQGQGPGKWKSGRHLRHAARTVWWGSADGKACGCPIEHPARHGVGGETCGCELIRGSRTAGSAATYGDDGTGHIQVFEALWQFAQGDVLRAGDHAVGDFSCFADIDNLGVVAALELFRELLWGDFHGLNLSVGRGCCAVMK